MFVYVIYKMCVRCEEFERGRASVSVIRTIGLYVERIARQMQDTAGEDKNRANAQARHY